MAKNLNATNSLYVGKYARNIAPKVHGTETTFFHPTQIHPNEYYETQKRASRIKEHRANIETQINSIVHHVHTELSDRRRSAPPKKTASSKTVRAKTPKANVRDQAVQTRLTTIDVPEPQRSLSSIPKLKALCGRKHQERKFHALHPNGDNTYEQQVRLRQVLDQRIVLEKMLAEHKKLQRDRQSIVREVNMMKNYLDNIRGRLDVTLKKLKTQ